MLTLKVSLKVSNREIKKKSSRVVLSNGTQIRKPIFVSAATRNG